MKRIQTILSGALLAQLAVAQPGATDTPDEPDASQSPPTPTAPPAGDEPASRSPRPALEPAAYMGISSAMASPAARAAAKLPRGVGVVVDYVDQGSPADHAGLRKGDIIHKLDDQIIVNNQQLTVLVRLRKADEIVSLSLVRDGKPQQLQVRLIEKNLPPVDQSIGLIVPHDMLDHGPLPRVGAGRVAGVLTHSDGEHTIVITTYDNRREIEIRDAAGAPVYRGPLNKPEDRQLIPEPLRAKVLRMERGAEEAKRLSGSADAN